MAGTQTLVGDTVRIWCADAAMCFKIFVIALPWFWSDHGFVAECEPLLVVDNKEFVFSWNCGVPSARRATRPQVFYRQHSLHEALPWLPVSFASTCVFADRFHAKFTMTRKAPLLHQIYCPTLHLRLLLAALDTPKVDPRGASKYSVSRGSDGNLWYTSVSCAQMSSELRLYCVSDGTHCSADVSVASGFSGSGGHTFPRADADRDLAKRQLVQRVYDEILHIRSRLDDPPGARETDQNGRGYVFHRSSLVQILRAARVRPFKTKVSVSWLRLATFSRT